MKDPLISIIVPVYRVEKYLYRCIDSILTQAYRNIELILIDDGSDDSCPAICDSYSNKDQRVRVYHKPNGGLSDARNFGIEKATGEFLVFIDSDDFVSSKMIEHLVENQIKDNSDIVICTFEYVDESGISLPKQKQLKEPGIYSNEQIFRFYDVDGMSWILGVAWNKLYKKDLFSNIRYPRGRLHEDDFVSFLIYDEAERISIIDESLYYYTQRSQSIMGNIINVRHADGAIAALNRIDFAKKTARQYLIPKAEKQAFDKLFSVSMYAKKSEDKQYLKPIIEQYSKTYNSIRQICELSYVERFKRKILIDNGFMLYLCTVIANIIRYSRN